MTIVTEFAATLGYTNNGDSAGFVAARSYRYWRARGFTAAKALERARDDRTARYPAGVAINPRNDKREAWVERPADVGLRFVGWSDNLAGRAVDHTGWFLNDESFGDVARGCVFQLPGRKGQARFVAAYQQGSTNRAGDWSDMSGVEGSALVAFGEIFTEVTDGESNVREYQAARDAATRADRMAELMAESERDYQAAWQKGNEAREAISDARTFRSNAVRLLSEVRGKLAADMPETCKAIRRTIASHLESAREEYAKAQRLFAEYGHEDAFTEGASAATYWELRK